MLLFYTLILILAAMLRLTGGLNTMLFTYDQARDAFYAQSILAGNWKIVGPPTDLGGVFHGPLYYYFLAPFYGLGHGDPRFAVLGMILVNIAAMIPLWFLAKGLFKNKLAALTALLLFAVSFEAVSYARWLSNPTLAVLPLAMFYLGLWRIISGQKSGYVIAALGLGLAIQAQLFLLYLGVILVTGLVLFRAKIDIGKPLLTGLLALLLLTSTFFIAEIKFHGQGVRGLSSFLMGQNKTSFSLSEKLENFVQRERELFARNLTPLFPAAAGILALSIIAGNIYLAKKTKAETKPTLFALFLLVSPLPVFLASRMDLTFITVGVGLAVILLAANLAVKVPRWVGLIFLLFVAGNNIAHVVKTNPQGNITFQVQEGMKLADEIKVVQKTYELSNGGEMSILAVTNPLFYPTLWAYLYQWQSKSNGRVVPFYHGTTTYAFQGDWIFPRSDDKRATDLTIVEPQPGIPEDWKTKILAEESLRGPTIKIIEVGKFTLLVRNAPALQ